MKKQKAKEKKKRKYTWSFKLWEGNLMEEENEVWDGICLLGGKEQERKKSKGGKVTK